MTPDLAGLPYQLPGRVGPGVAQEQLQALSIRQDSGGWTPLQGVNFTLNNRSVLILQSDHPEHSLRLDDLMSIDHRG